MIRNTVRSFALLAVLAVTAVAVAGHLNPFLSATGFLPGVDAQGGLDFANGGRQKYTYTCTYNPVLGIKTVVCVGRGNVPNLSCKRQEYVNRGLGGLVLEQLGFSGPTTFEAYCVEAVTPANKSKRNFWVCDTFLGVFLNVSPRSDD